MAPAKNQPQSLTGPVFGLWMLAGVLAILPFGSEHGSIFFIQPLLTTAAIGAALHAALLARASTRRSQSPVVTSVLGAISAGLGLVVFSASWGEGALGVFVLAPEIAALTFGFGVVTAVLITLLYVRRKAPAMKEGEGGAA